MLRIALQPVLLATSLLLPCCGPDVYGAGQLPVEMSHKPAGRQTIVLVGDTMIWDRAREHLERHGAGYPFGGTAPLLRTADVTVGNLEGPVAVEAELGKAVYPYKVPPWTLAGLKDAGFDLVSLANNHLLDCGREGLDETIGHLEQAGIGHFGAGRNPEEAERPAVVELSGVKIAFLGLLASETDVLEAADLPDALARERKERSVRGRYGARANRAGTIVADVESVSRLVRLADEQADLVVLFPHWGIRYHRPPTEFQRRVARAAVEAGADLIVGHHAHFWQPVELVDGVPVVYGTGNFAFGSANRRADEGLLVRATVGRGRVEQVELFPLYIKNADSSVRYQPKVMRGGSARELIERVGKLSVGLDRPIDFEGGRGVIKLPDRDRKR